MWDVSDVLNSQANYVEVLEEPNWCCEVLRSLLQDPSAHNVMFVTSDGSSVSGNKAIYTIQQCSMLCSLIMFTPVEKWRYHLIPSVDAETFTSLLSYIYTGKVAVSSVTCLDMLGAAMHFKITTLVTKLIIFPHWTTVMSSPLSYCV